MTDPLDTPPEDHGSDRFGYVELIGAPPGIDPPPAWVDTLRCPDCLSNLFLTYLGVTSTRPKAAHVWQPRIAHDDGCPTFARLQAEGRA